MLITGIHHVSMKCCNEAEYEKSVDFYRNILGLTIARTWPQGIMFQVGSSVIEIFNDGDESLPKGVIRHFALSTTDVDACAETVKAAGYEVFIGPKEIVIPSNPLFHARMAFCKGPLGEEIEFFQEQI